MTAGKEGCFLMKAKQQRGKSSCMSLYGFRTFGKKRIYGLVFPNLLFQSFYLQSSKGWEWLQLYVEKQRCSLWNNSCNNGRNNPDSRTKKPINWAESRKQGWTEQREMIQLSTALLTKKLILRKNATSLRSGYWEIRKEQKQHFRDAAFSQGHGWLDAVKC